jgi:Tfp pilus assembly protein PilF
MVIEAGRCRWKVNEPRAIVASILVIGALSFCTVNQINLWRDEVTLYGNAIGRGGADSFMLGNYGSALIKSNRPIEAVVALERAAQLSPERAEHWYNLAVAKFQLGEYKKALELVDRSVSIGQGAYSVEALVLSARINLIDRNFDVAMDQFARAVETGADRRQTAITLHDAGITLARERKLTRAASLIERALRIDVTFEPARQALALIRDDIQKRE